MEVDENNEKVLLFIKILTISVIGCIIFIFSLFVVALERVDALEFSDAYLYQYNTNNVYESGNSCAAYSTCYTSTTNGNNVKNQLKLYYNASSFWSDQAYTFTINYRVAYLQTIANPSGTITLGGPSIYWEDSNENKTQISDNCATSYSQTLTVQLGHRLKTYTFQTRCTWVVPPSTMKFVSIVVPYATNITNISSIALYYDSYSDFKNKFANEVTEDDRINDSLNNINGTLVDGFGNIISNQNSNTNAIIDNDNANTDRTIDAINNQNKKCDNISITNDLGEQNYDLNANGNTQYQANFNVSKYIPLNYDKIYTLTKDSVWGTSRMYCIYDQNKVKIGCYEYGNNTSYTITNANFIRYTWSTGNNRYVTLSGQYCYNLIEKQNDELNDINDSINDDSIDMSGFDDFNVVGSDGGVTAIITSPLQAIQSILNNTCSDIILPIPFTNKTFNMPCLTPIYQQHFSSILTLWQVIVTGIVSYWICLNIYHMVHGFTDPNDDKIEVVDL